MTSLKKHWPLWLGLALLVGVVGWTVGASLAAASGHFVYSLDDTYITMAMAKNLATHGVWGVTPHGFSSTNSSPLWLVMVTATYLAFGVNNLSPLILNVLAAVLLVVVGYRGLRGLGLGDRAVAVLLAAVILAGPVATLTMVGLEHVLHGALCVAFLCLLAAELDAARPPAPSRRRWLYLVAAALVVCRYESLVLIGAGSAMLVLRGRRLQAGLLVVAAFLPMAAYGLLSVSHGWTFIPTTVLLKRQRPKPGWEGVVGLLGGNALGQAQDAPELVALALAGVAVLVVMRARLRGGGWLRTPPATMIVLALVVTLAHLQLARVGTLCRYEAYLVVMWIVALGVAAPQMVAPAAPLARVWRRGRVTGAALAAVLAMAALPLAARSYQAAKETPIGSGEIYQQQIQMGRFVHEFFEGRRVGVQPGSPQRFVIRKLVRIPRTSAEDLRDVMELVSRRYG